MSDNRIRLITGEHVSQLLEGKEAEIINLISDTYTAHNNGKSELPHSHFLNFKNAPKNRIIALPAYLGDKFDIAGIKWIASFPDNIKNGIDRASAVNNPEFNCNWQTCSSYGRINYKCKANSCKRYTGCN